MGRRKKDGGGEGDRDKGDGTDGGEEIEGEGERGGIKGEGKMAEREGERRNKGGGERGG